MTNDEWTHSSFVTQKPGFSILEGGAQCGCQTEEDCRKQDPIFEFINKPARRLFRILPWLTSISDTYQLKMALITSALAISTL
jgi:hypothetical protein